MNIETGREFGFTNPQDDPHLYAAPPPGFSYNIDGTLRAVPSYNRAVNRPFQPPRPSFSSVHRTTQVNPVTTTLTPLQIRDILQRGTFLPNARGPGKITYCDACRKSGLQQSIAYEQYDICLNCAQKYK